MTEIIENSKVTEICIVSYCADFLFHSDTFLFFSGKGTYVFYNHARSSPSGFEKNLQTSQAQLVFFSKTLQSRKHVPFFRLKRKGSTGSKSGKLLNNKMCKCMKTNNQ